MKKKTQQTKTIVGYFDGACEPTNPGGNMGIGSCVKIAGIDVFSHSKFVASNPKNSNNVAEYMAFKSILNFLHEQKITNTTVHIYGDSKLVIEQMFGTWKMKGGLYVEHAIQARTALLHLVELNKIRFFAKWIPREQNTYADELSKLELVKNNIEFRIQPNSLKESQILNSWKDGADPGTPVHIKPDYVHVKYKS